LGHGWRGLEGMAMTERFTALNKKLAPGTGLAFGERFIIWMN